jgi:membrane protein required for colicin V production
LNWLDIIIIILIVVPGFIGLKAGIIKALFTVAGVIVGVVLAGRLSDSLGGVLPFISNPEVAKLVAFAVILVVVMIIASIAAKLVKWAVSAVLMGWLNRLGGAILGVVLGMIFCGAVLTMWVNYLGINSVVENSALAGFLLNSFPIVLGLLPSEFDSVRSFFR